MDIALQKLIDSQNKTPFTGILVALDPGQTTGYAIFNASNLIEAGQLETKNIEEGMVVLNNFLHKHNPDYVVYEAYRVYQHKTQDHANSDLHTSQFIGCIKVLCIQQGIKYYNQMASVAKQFCTDDKLRSWGMWIKSKKHARDAVRHALYFLVFNYKKVKEKNDVAN
jgi:hypothetical protein